MVLLPGKTIGLPKSAGVARCALERINDTWSPQTKQPVPVSFGAPVTFVGWAIDEQHKAIAGGVDILIDGMPYAANYQLERGDVADFLKVPGYKNSGFSAIVPPSKLVEKGHHDVTFRVLANDGKSYYDCPKIDFEVR